jgi:hypothetical protein
MKSSQVYLQKYINIRLILYYPMVYELSDIESNNKVKKKIYHVWSQNGKKEPRPDNVTSVYKMATYDKDMMCFNEPFATRQYRSVVYSHPEDRLLSFSPPRSLPLGTFSEEYGIEDRDIQISELIEGNLIHLFYDDRMTSWEIATKNAVGGNYRLFYKSGKKEKKRCGETVRNMFLEALGFSKNAAFDEIQGFESLNKDFCYCFVLQHPKNTIVMLNDRPTLYLVSVYDVLCDAKMARMIPQYEYETWQCFQDLPKIQFPELYHFSNYADCVNSLNETRANYSIMGYNIANLTTGERCVILNQVYKNVYLMKGQSDDVLYLYLCMRRIEKVKEFLFHFPKYKKIFSKFYEQYREFIKNIHAAYLEKWIYKKLVHQKYTRYVDRLHKEIYLPSLKTLEPEKMSRKVVVDFINRLEPEEVLYFMNYDRRAFQKISEL